MPATKPTIITLTGPSCAGKTVLANRLTATGRCEEGISVTTRPPRAKEIDGVHYRFLSQEAFGERSANSELLERIDFGGYWYGWPASEAERITAAGKSAVAVVEPRGVAQIAGACQARGWRLLTVFLDTNPELRYQRLLTRLLDDYLGAPPSVGLDALPVVRLIGGYAKRLAAMAEIERGWRDAWDYDRVVKDFGADTETAIIADVLAADAERPVL